VTRCAYCGENIEQFGTTLNTQLFIEERTFTIRPSFCSWQHAASWFNSEPPDIAHWTQIGKKKAPADGGVVTWLIAIGLLIALLATVISLIVFLP